MTSRSAAAARLALLLVPLGVVAIACSSNNLGTSQACNSDSDCKANQLCLFPIGSCDAHSICVDAPRTGCDSYEELCSCTHFSVTRHCALAYADGPSTGATGVMYCFEDAGADQ